MKKATHEGWSNISSRSVDILKSPQKNVTPPFPGVMLILITTYNFLFCFGHSMWDLSSLIRDQTWVSCAGSTSLYHLHFKAILCVSLSVVSSSVRPHRLQPTRLLCLWDLPGKNTREGCHFLLQGIFPDPDLHLFCLLIGFFTTVPSSNEVLLINILGIRYIPLKWRTSFKNIQKGLGIQELLYIVIIIIL